MYQSRDHSEHNARWTADRHGTVTLLESAEQSGTYDKHGKRIADKRGKPVPSDPYDRPESEVIDSINELLAVKRESAIIEWILYGVLMALGAVLASVFFLTTK